MGEDPRDDATAPSGQPAPHEGHVENDAMQSGEQSAAADSVTETPPEYGGAADAGTPRGRHIIDTFRPIMALARKSTITLVILILVPIFTAFVGGVLGGIIVWRFTYSQERADQAQDETDKREQAAEQERIRESNPLDIRVSSPLVNIPGMYEFALVVTDPDRLELGPEPPLDQSCPQLWSKGTQAGGKPPTWNRYNVTVSGNVPSTVAIVGLCATITKRADPENGALLMCMPIQMGTGAQQGPKLTFDLTSSDQAEAVVTTGTGGPAQQFHDGFQLHVPQNDATNFTIEARLPDASVEWHVEADIVFGDTARTIVINDTANKTDFSSPGLLPTGNYEELILGWGGVIPGTWSRGNSVAELESLLGREVVLPNPATDPEVFAPPQPGSQTTNPPG